MSLGRVPRTLSRVSVSRNDSTACFSAHTWKATFLFCGAHDPESDFTSPVPTEKQIITEHDHGVETRTASICTRSQDRGDWCNPLFVDMDSGVGGVMQSPGGLDSSAVRLQSNLDEPDGRDFADTQHAPLSNSCDESETPVGAALARSVLQQEAAQQRDSKTPCQVSHACGTCGEAQAEGTTRNQPCFCRAATEEQRATHRRAVRCFHSRGSPASTSAGALKGDLLQPVWSGKRWRFAEAAKVSV